MPCWSEGLQKIHCLKWTTLDWAVSTSTTVLFSSPRCTQHHRGSCTVIQSASTASCNDKQQIWLIVDVPPLPSVSNELIFYGYFLRTVIWVLQIPALEVSPPLPKHKPQCCKPACSSSVWKRLGCCGVNVQHVDRCGVAGAGQSFTPCRCARGGCDAWAEPISVSICSLQSHCRTDSDAGRLSPAGRGAGQGGLNHQSKINADDDPMGNLMGGNETLAFG